MSASLEWRHEVYEPPAAPVDHKWGCCGGIERVARPAWGFLSPRLRLRFPPPPLSPARGRPFALFHATGSGRLCLLTADRMTPRPPMYPVLLRILRMAALGVSEFQEPGKSGRNFGTDAATIVPGDCHVQLPHSPGRHPLGSRRSFQDQRLG